MQIVTIFNPAATTSGTFNVQFSNGTGKMLVINESAVNLTLQLPDGSTTYVPAGDRRLYCFSAASSTVQWQQQSILGGQAPEVSQVIIETYQPNEKIIETYPSPLTRQTQIQNIEAAVSSATVVTNDGNAAGTTILEATVSGDATSAVKLTNDGQLTLGTSSRPADVIFTGTFNAANNNFQIDQNGNIVSCGVITFNANEAVLRDSGNNIILQNNGGNRQIMATSGHFFIITINGIDVLSIDGNGNLIIKGSLTQHGTPQ